MTPSEQESILTLALMAAFADGAKHHAERTELKRIAERLPHADVQPAALYQRVLLKQVTPAQAASSVLSFATTWALGKLAQQYHAGGRKLSAIELRSTFGLLTEPARSLHSRYAGDIQQKAGSVNVSQLLPLIRGQ